jgi:GTPase SAR1 family protein
MVSELRLEQKEDKTIIQQIKIVYWGPGESGKTTNYEMLLKHFADKKISKGFEINTTDKRTLWQDSAFLNFNIRIKGKNFQFITHVTTCTGQERFLSTREYVIHGADGVIFVADSDPKKMNENVRSYRELLAFLANKEIPWLIQLNKRDLKNAITIEEFKDKMNLPKALRDEKGHLFVYPSVVLNNQNVIEIFGDLMEQIIYKRMKS